MCAEKQVHKWGGYRQCVQVCISNVRTRVRKRKKGLYRCVFNQYRITTGSSVLQMGKSLCQNPLFPKTGFSTTHPTLQTDTATAGEQNIWNFFSCHLHFLFHQSKYFCTCWRQRAVKNDAAVWKERKQAQIRLQGNQKRFPFLQEICSSCFHLSWLVMRG